MSVLPLNRTPGDLSFLTGDGEMRARCRALNWAATPLGPVTTWSHSLRTTVATMLASHHPMFLWWGPELVQIYNDGYRPSLAGGGRHPRALGMRGREFWTDIWHIIGPQIDAVMSRGESSWNVDQLVPIDRNGHLEEVYWTYGYSPVLDDDGTIGGTLVVCQETTNAVVATRRLQTLHTLAAFTPQRTLATTAAETTRLLVADGYDVPFAMCFLLHRNDSDHRASPNTDQTHSSQLWKLAHAERVSTHTGLTSSEHWPLDDVIKSRELQKVTIPVMTMDEQIGPWSELPQCAVIVPLIHPRTSTPLGALVLGVSARLQWDTAYENFVHLATADVATHLAACHDQMERDRMDRALNVERTRLEFVFQSAPSFLAVLRGPTHIYELANDAYYQIVGHRDLLGKPIAEALPELIGQGFDDLLDDVLRTGIPFIGRELSVNLQRNPGAPLEQRFVDAYYIPIIEADGRISGIVAHGMDVTDSVLARQEVERLLTESEAERRDAELARAAAEDANRVKADFLATMSHELRTPLNAIGGYAELIMLGIHGPVTPAQQDALSRLQTSQRHLLGLINDLLNYTRLEAGVVHYDLRATSVQEILNVSETLISPQMRMKDLRFHCDPCSEPLQVCADSEKLRQILLNLLTNATKFTESGGTITISTAVVDDMISICVTDTGCGIATEQFENIFDPFVQVDARLTRAEQGIGLGLAISRDLARGMGGNLTVQSTVGVGSTFTVVLPRA